MFGWDDDMSILNGSRIVCNVIHGFHMELWLGLRWRWCMFRAWLTLRLRFLCMLWLELGCRLGLRFMSRLGLGMVMLFFWFIMECIHERIIIQHGHNRRRERETKIF